MKGIDYQKDEIFKLLLSSLEEKREKSIYLCLINQSIEHIDKYLYRKVPFNYIYVYNCENPDCVVFNSSHYYVFSNEFKKNILDLSEIF